MHRTRRRAGAACAALALAGLGSILLQPTAVSAAGSRSFNATASADGVHTLVSSPGAPLTDEVADLAGPSAAARLSSIGISTGFAAYPYPGATVLGAPSTAGTSAVAYPLTASSSYPVTPSQQVGQGPFLLSATSKEAESSAAASSGQDDPTASGGLVSSKAHVQQTGDTVTAESSSEDRDLAAGPLAIGRVVATAKVTRGAEGDPTLSSSFHAEGLSAAGNAFGLGPEGLTVAGTTTPLPDTSPVTTVLAGGGVTVTYLAPQKTATGIISAGLKVVFVSPQGQRTTTILGQAAAAIGQTVDPGDPGTFLPPPAPLPTEPVSGPPPVVPVTGGTTPVTSGQPPTVPAQPEVAPTTAAAPTTPALTRTAVVGWPRSFFLVLAAGGVLAVAAASMLATLGVRFP